MTYVLDTNAVSELMRGNPVVLDRLHRTKRADVFMPQPVLAELEYGIARLGASKRKRQLVDQLEVVRSRIARATWTDAVSAAFATIKATLERRGARIEDLDIAIAAHALAVEGTLVTANIEHMARVPGLVVEDWARLV